MWQLGSCLDYLSHLVLIRCIKKRNPRRICLFSVPAFVLFLAGLAINAQGRNRPGHQSSLRDFLATLFTDPVRALVDPVQGLPDLHNQVSVTIFHAQDETTVTWSERSPKLPSEGVISLTDLAASCNSASSLSVRSLRKYGSFSLAIALGLCSVRGDSHRPSDHQTL